MLYGFYVPLSFPSGSFQILILVYLYFDEFVRAKWANRKAKSHFHFVCYALHYNLVLYCVLLDLCLFFFSLSFSFHFIFLVVLFRSRKKKYTKCDVDITKCWPD